MVTITELVLVAICAGLALFVVLTAIVVNFAKKDVERRHDELSRDIVAFKRDLAHRVWKGTSTYDPRSDIDYTKDKWWL